ncbi:MAG: hypothetical protein EP343_10770 [Deltaproteobacteria bacterium]|nr:MAG: hypothetical protein EP343_10770 [Deltaproteobacteria bacterium]
MIALLLGLQLMGGWPAVHAANTASMALATQPAGANYTLYNIQGKVVLTGKTPYIGLVPEGRYRLVIQKPGFFPEQRSLQITGGQQKILQVTLFPKPAGTAPTTPPQPRAGTTPTPARPAAQPPARPAPRPRPVARPAPDLRPVVRGVPTLPNVPASRPKPQPKAQSPAVGPPQPRSVEGPPPPPASNEVPPKPGTKKSGQTSGGNESSANAKKIVTKKKKPKKAKRSIPWIPLAAAGGLAIAGGIFWGLSTGALDASQDVNRTQIDAFNEYKQARSHRNTAVFLFAGSGVALGLAALFYFWPQSNSKKKKSPVPGNDVPIIGFSFESY